MPPKSFTPDTNIPSSFVEDKTPEPSSFASTATDILTTLFPVKNIGEAIGTKIAQVQAPPELKKYVAPSQATKMQIFGDVLGNALYFTPFGTIEAAVSKLIPATVARIATGAGVGLGVDVASRLSEGQTTGVFRPGLGTAIGTAIPALGPAARGVSRIAGETLGGTTGAGYGAIKAGMEAASQGGKIGTAFTESLRGGISPEQIVTEAKDALGSIIERRSEAYKNSLSTLKTATKTYDISPVQKKFSSLLQPYGVAVKNGELDFTRSPGLGRYSGDVNNMLKVLKDWGSKPGDRTVVGIDTLKQTIDDFRRGTAESKTLDSLVTALRNEAQGIIKDVPGYSDMVKNYAESTGLIKEIQRGLSLSDKAITDTAFRKLTTALRTNNEFRKQLVTELNQETGGLLIPKIAGQQLSETLPRGLARPLTSLGVAGATFGLGGLNLLITALATSPRLVGEIINALGVGAKGSKIILDALEKRLGAFQFPGDTILKKIQETPNKQGGFIKIGDSSHLAEAEKALRESKGLSANDIMQTFPDIQLKRDVPVTDIHGNKVVIPEGEALTPYELKGNKVLLQDGETYIVSKNQYQNIKGQAVSGEAKPFAPELAGTEESVRSGENDVSSKGAKALKMFNKPFDELTTAQKAKINAEVAVETQPTKYSSYQLPDGKNYKEILIKAPGAIPEPKGKVLTPTEFSGSANGDFGYELNGVKSANSYATKSAAQSAFERVRDKVWKNQETTNFKSSHWDEPNVISHLRLNERTYQGKKVTFMEELQSDWAREARKKGFSSHDQKVISDFETYHAELAKKYGVNPLQNVAMYKTLKNIPEAEIAKYDRLSLAANEARGGVPNNPLLKNWQELSVKRALKEAVDNNSEYFAWINGEQTSARYNLATYIDNVKWGKTTNAGKAERYIDLLDKNNKSIMVWMNDKGVIRKSSQGDWSGKKLDEVLGKGLADKIMAEETGTLSGEGLKFGGEWANNLYDKQVGNIVSDLTGAKVEKLDLGLPIDNKTTKWILHEKSGNSADKFAGVSDLKTGKTIYKEGVDPYIITDILGDGKFKAVPKNEVPRNFEQLPNGKTRFETSGGIVELRKGGYGLVDWAKEYSDHYASQTFAISTKKTTQQGIKITPEIRAIVNGESPLLKKPSGKEIVKKITLRK
jgi:hypothetical protein